MIRKFNAQKDCDDLLRIWNEVGWLQKDQEHIATYFSNCGEGWVYDINNRPECVVLTTTGTLNFINYPLPFAAITGVPTSRVARKQGIALKLTAHAITECAANGAAVCGLGMFEQGFYLLPV